MMTGPSALQEATAAAIAMRWSLWLLTVPPQRDGAGQWAAGPGGDGAVIVFVNDKSVFCLSDIGSKNGQKLTDRCQPVGFFDAKPLCIGNSRCAACPSHCNGHDRHQIWKLCCTYCFAMEWDSISGDVIVCIFSFDFSSPIFSSTVMISLSLCVESGSRPVHVISPPSAPATSQKAAFGSRLRLSVRLVPDKSGCPGMHSGSSSFRNSNQEYRSIQMVPPFLHC